LELSVNDLKFGYTKKMLVVKGISFSAQPGQLITLIGPNGSGKTTIVKCLNRINWAQKVRFGRAGDWGIGG